MSTLYLSQYSIDFQLQIGQQHHIAVPQKCLMDKMHYIRCSDSTTIDTIICHCVDKLKWKWKIINLFVWSLATITFHMLLNYNPQDLSYRTHLSESEEQNPITKKLSTKYLCGFCQHLPRCAQYKPGWIIHSIFASRT